MSSKALFIVEGKREDHFFTTLAHALGLGIEIVQFRGNISMLYDEMVKLGFMADVTKILLSKRDPKDPKDADDIEKLKAAYTDIVLVFDFDPQHNIRQLSGETVDAALRRNAAAVYSKALRMAQDLNNSTDPTRGKLYINYPSIESFRDANDFFDDQYATRKVQLLDLCKELGGAGYKKISARTDWAKKNNDPKDYEKLDFANLAKMNAFKLRLITDGQWAAFTYGEFRTHSEQDAILKRQKDEMDSALCLWVLNTSLFFVFDYLGQPYYDSVCLKSKGKLVDPCGGICEEPPLSCPI